MPYDTFTPRLAEVARQGQAYLTNLYGAAGLQIETEVDKNISWKPSFFLKRNQITTIAVEVSDSVYPQILKLALNDLRLFDRPIAAYSVCPLESYQSDRDEAQTKILKRDGFGLITVNSIGEVAIQHPCIVTAQHVSESELEAYLQDVSTKYKRALRDIHRTYLSNATQGLQEIGQIVENMVVDMGQGCVRLGYLRQADVNTTLALLIERIWALPRMGAHRGALGSARDFVNNYRNASSHPPRNVRAAMARIRHGKTGFLLGVRVVQQLEVVASKEKFRIRLRV